MRLGKFMMTMGRIWASIRDKAFTAAVKVPPVRRYLTEMRYKPPPRYRDGMVVSDFGDDHDLVGALLPQPRVLTHDGRQLPLDDVLGPGGPYWGSKHLTPQTNSLIHTGNCLTLTLSRCDSTIASRTRTTEKSAWLASMRNSIVFLDLTEENSSLCVLIASSLPYLA